MWLLEPMPQIIFLTNKEERDKPTKPTVKHDITRAVIFFLLNFVLLRSFLFPSYHFLVGSLPCEEEPTYSDCRVHIEAAIKGIATDDQPPTSTLLGMSTSFFFFSFFFIIKKNKMKKMTTEEYDGMVEINFTFFPGNRTRTHYSAHQDEFAVEKPLSEEPPPVPEPEQVEATGEEEELSSAEEDHHPVTDHGESISTRFNFDFNFSYGTHFFFFNSLLNIGYVKKIDPSLG